MTLEEELKKTIKDYAIEAGITDPHEIEIYKKGWLRSNQRSMKVREAELNNSLTQLKIEVQKYRDRASNAYCEYREIEKKLQETKKEIEDTKYPWKECGEDVDLPNDKIFVFETPKGYLIVRPVESYGQFFYEYYSNIGEWKHILIRPEKGCRFLAIADAQRFAVYKGGTTSGGTTSGLTKVNFRTRPKQNNDDGYTLPF